MLNHVGTQPLETSRLILRRYEMSDADDIYNNWVTDPEVSRFWGWKPHKDINETKSELVNWIEDYSKTDIYHWVIILKSIAQAIGYIYLNKINDTDDSVSVHFLLSRKYWNQGIMPEACKEVLEFAFSVLRVKRVHTHHHIDNPASGRVMQKCGMRYIKTEYTDKDCEPINGDYNYYEITIDDWKRTE